MKWRAWEHWDGVWAVWARLRALMEFVVFVDYIPFLISYNNKNPNVTLAMRSRIVTRWKGQWDNNRVFFGWRADVMAMMRRSWMAMLVLVIDVRATSSAQSHSIHNSRLLYQGQRSIRNVDGNLQISPRVLRKHNGSWSLRC
jgi:hypothetical protein